LSYKIKDTPYTWIKLLHDHVNDIAPTNLDKWLEWADGGNFYLPGEPIEPAIDAVIKAPWPYDN
jgi:hypothetical protein